MIKLSLNNVHQNPPLEEYPYIFVRKGGVCEKRWSLNVSLLHPFKELRDLNLSHNAIGGWITNKGTLISFDTYSTLLFQALYQIYIY